MSIFAHLFFFIMGVLMVFWIFKGEKKRFDNGKIGRYVKVRKANCSEQYFVARLKASIFKSFVIRLVIVGVLFCAIFGFALMVDEGASLADSGLSGLGWLGFWVSSSMIALADRANSAMWGRF